MVHFGGGGPGPVWHQDSVCFHMASASRLTSGRSNRFAGAIGQPAPLEQDWNFPWIAPELMPEFAKS